MATIVMIQLDFQTVFAILYRQFIYTGKSKTLLFVAPPECGYR